MTRRATESDDSTKAAEPTDVGLPPWKAFVVQLTRDTDAIGGVFAGRVEHLGSGRRVRFESREALLAAISGLLGEIAGEDR